MLRFLETVFRHRILVLAPMVLAILAAVGYGLAQPRSYEASASLWIEATGPGNAATTTPADQYTQPSDRQAAVIRELLSTRAFAVAVAHRGPLAKYLADHPNEQKGLAAVKGIGVLFRTVPGSVDDRAVTQLAGDVTVATAGPQVVTVLVQGATGVVATGTAKALVDEFSTQILATKSANAQATADYYGKQVAGAQVTLQQAQSTLGRYLGTHPAVPTSGAGDGVATQMSQAVDLAQRRYLTIVDQYEQSQLDLANVANQTGFRVIDEPSLPGAPVAFKKRLLMAGIGGALAGLLVSIMVLMVLTAADRSARRPSELERSLGLDVVAGVRRYPRRRSVSGSSP